jgi:hypothetical protein
MKRSIGLVNRRLIINKGRTRVKYALSSGEKLWLVGSLSVELVSFMMGGDGSWVVGNSSSLEIHLEGRGFVWIVKHLELIWDYILMQIDYKVI